jgi:GWxTD domain-containing protein
VASAGEAWAYQGTPEASRSAFLRRFWLRHDPTLVTGGAQRQVEHYRRVWYARSYFGEKRFPWDRRGEVYIRYGEPDYRSTSKNINMEASPAVRRVQERIAYEMYGDRAVGVTFTGPIFPVQIDRSVQIDVSQFEEGIESPDPEVITRVQPGIAGQDTLGLSRWRPMVMGMDPGRIPWEVWVYTGIEDGIEVVFTDQTLSGAFDYAPTPVPGAEDFRRLQEPGALSNMLATFNRHAPGVVMQRAVSTTPEHYNVAREAESIQFSYDVADFRGPEGMTRSEVYAAIPLRQFSLASGRDTAVIVERIAALVDSAFDRVYRSKDQMIYTGGMEAGAVLMDQADLLAPPGKYTLAVQVQQKGTSRMQVYRRAVTVEGYPSGGLRLSDLQVARQVGPPRPGEVRFVKRGWKVSPAPGRNFYEGQSVFLYFEVYNLTRDGQGHTRFEVSYSVSARQARPLVVRALSGLGRLLGTEGAGEVTFRHERGGMAASDADYVELDMKDSGAGEFVVRVTVRDLLSGTGAQKEAAFKVVPGG